MSKNTEELVLKIIFGFVLISAIDSVLYLVANLISAAELILEVPVVSAIVSIPLLTFGFYSFTIYQLIKIANRKDLNIENLFQHISKPMLWVVFIVAIFLDPLTHKLSGLFSVYYISSESFYLSTEDYLDVYGWTTAGVGFSRWSALIILTIVFWRNYSGRPIKN